MDTILATVTALSLVFAGAMGALLVRMLREERRRSDARVALLEQLAAEPRTGHGSTPAAVQHGSARATEQHGPTRATVQHGSTRTAVQHGPTPQNGPTLQNHPTLEDTRHGLSREALAEAAVSLDDLDLRPGIPPGSIAEHEIFQAHEAPSAWPRRVVVAGAMAAVLAAVVFGWSTLPSRTPGAPLNQTAAQAGDQPLELLSLQHAQQEGTLVISGLVQNPRTGSARAHVLATVMLFGPDGALVTSGRAPLDFTTLAPGAESPFVIRVPVSRAVSRYRVGFRGENHRVLGHVDRRDPEALARKQGP